MRAIRVCLVVVGLLGMCACAGKSEFVRLSSSPVSAEPTQTGRQPYEDGHLRIFVSSNLDTNGRVIDFGKEDERPALLLISARFRGTVASFAAGVDPEIPVLLYDVQAGKTMSSVVSNALLTEGILVDPAALSKSPHPPATMIPNCRPCATRSRRCSSSGICGTWATSAISTHRTWKASTTSSTSSRRCCCRAIGGWPTG